MREDEARSYPKPVVQQPDPMLDEQPAGWFRIALTSLGAAAVVVLLMYGLSKPPEQPQMAAAEQGGQAQPAQEQPANAQPAKAPAQKPQPNAQAPTTTGQGSGGKGSGAGQTAPSKTPPAAGSSSDSAIGPGAKHAPQPK